MSGMVGARNVKFGVPIHHEKHKRKKKQNYVKGVEKRSRDLAARRSRVVQQRSGLTVGDTSACQTLRTVERCSSPIDWL